MRRIHISQSAVAELFARSSALAFVFVLALHLAPVWLFHFFPSQDGPSHLANAFILKDYGRPAAPYRDFFELRRELFPNWTSHLLLVGLLHLFSPLIAEKVLVTIYLVGFAYAWKAFITALGRNAQPLAPLGLLFLFNRCILMGFYNYCLSVVLFWWMLAYCLRCRGGLRLVHLPLLAGLFLVAYFTHPVGFALTAAATVWIAATALPRGLRNLAWLGIALAPSVALMLGYAGHSGLSQLSLLDAVAENVNHWWTAPGQPTYLGLLDDSQFRAYEGRRPLWTCTVWLLGALTLTTAAVASLRPRSTAAASRWPFRLLALGFGLLFVLIPDYLGDHGGCLRFRVGMLVPLMSVACFEVPRLPVLRQGLIAVVLVMAVANVLLVGRYFRDANRDIREFTAGIYVTQPGQRMFVEHWPDNRRVVDYLQHAADYYAVLARPTVNLDNYEAFTTYFPVKYRSDAVRGWGWFHDYPCPERVDLVLTWDVQPNLPPAQVSHFPLVFANGRLKLFERTVSPKR